MSYTYTVKKGDTSLNQIVQAHGFSDYKKAGVASVPSGNFDLIREGEEITLDNYSDGKVGQIGSNPPALSSNDLGAQYKEDSTKIDELLASGVSDPVVDDVEVPKDAPPVTPPPPADTSDYDRITTEMDALKVEQEAKAKADKIEYNALFDTAMRNLDSQTQSQIERINQTFDKLLKEKARISQLNIDSRKGFGLSTGSSLYMPVMMRDSISESERVASEKIADLESERDSLINQAKTARDSGEADLMRQKLTDIKTIEDNYRAVLLETEQNLRNRVTLERKIRTEEEDKRNTLLAKAFEEFELGADRYKDEYGELEEEERDAYIEKKMRETGLSYSEVYAVLEATQHPDYGIEKEKYDAEKAKIAVDTAQYAREKARLANIEKNLDIEKKQKALEDGGEVEDATPAEMQADIPDSFVSNERAEEERQKFIKKYGSNGKKEWEARFPYDKLTESTKYPIKKSTEEITPSTMHDKAIESATRKKAEETAVGETVIINGKKYKKIGEDDYELVD